MDIGLLKAFIEVYRTRHFGNAARNLFISQSAVSARIRQLESELGIRLFTRDRNNIDLTPAGKKFLNYAENLLNTWNQARQDIAIPEGKSTLLSVAALPSIWDIFLESWLHWVHLNDHDLVLQADVTDSDALLRRLLDGSLDLAFVFDPPKTPELLIKELSPVPLIMISSTEGLDAGNAISENYVYVDWGTSFGMLHARQYPDLPPPVLRAAIGRIAYGFIVNCGGSAYLPEPMVQDQLGKTLFRVDNAPVIHKDAYAVYSQHNNKQPIIEDTLKWFDQH
ncbi:MAG: LysR family transcriptional regulator [Gammaproteobacteria bacterium]|nr:LysR family transcriptional regulator [Gammaproteobacteria bacterium]